MNHWDVCWEAASSDTNTPSATQTAAPLVHPKTCLSASSEEFHFLSKKRIIPPLFLFCGFWKRFWPNNQRSTLPSQLNRASAPWALDVLNGPKPLKRSPGILKFRACSVCISVDFTRLLQNKWGRAFVICSQNPRKMNENCAAASWLSGSVRRRRLTQPRSPASECSRCSDGSGQTTWGGELRGKHTQLQLQTVCFVAEFCI